MTRNPDSHLGPVLSNVRRGGTRTCSVVKLGDHYTVATQFSERLCPYHFCTSYEARLWAENHGRESLANLERGV